MNFVECPTSIVKLQGVEIQNVPINLDLCSTFYKNTSVRGNGVTIHLIIFEIPNSKSGAYEWAFISKDDRDASHVKLLRSIGE